MNTDLIFAKAIIDLAETTALVLRQSDVDTDYCTDIRNSVAPVRNLYEKLSRVPSPAEEVQKELEDEIRKANDRAILGDGGTWLSTEDLRTSVNTNKGLGFKEALLLVIAHETLQRDVAYWKNRYADTQRDLEAMRAAYVRSLRE